MDSCLNLPQLAELLHAAPVGHRIEHHARVTSTMPLARALAQQGAAGAVVVADEQTAGRGRLQRTWQAPAGTALLSTTVFAGALLPARPADLPMIAGLAVIQAMADMAPALESRLYLKWPNDVLLESDQEMGKVAGILVESAFQGDSLAYALLGIGINVNQTPDHLPATPPGQAPAVSIRTALGAPLDRTALLAALCRALAAVAQEPPEARFQRWRDRLATLGRWVTASTATDAVPIRGRAVDVTRDGALVVETAEGARHEVAAGDVTLRPGLNSDRG